MDANCEPDPETAYPGEWVAISRGRVVAHGRDFHLVAEEACQRADDIIFEQVPDPDSPLWEPEPLDRDLAPSSALP